MRLSRPGLLVSVLLMGCGPLSPPGDDVATIAGEYLGQVTPGLEPVLFAPGVISTELGERDLAFSPGGREVYWTLYVAAARRGTVVGMRRGEDDRWSAPEIPGIFIGHNSLEPFVTVDGQWLWFASDRPLPGESKRGDWNLWRAPRRGGDWGDPEPLPAPVNGDGNEFYPSLTRDGALLFTAELEGGLGGEDLWMTTPTPDGWSEPVNIGPAVNSPGPEFNALIHPDGDWIVFGSVRDGDAGGGDLYVSFADGIGGWTEAVAAAALNSDRLDFCPALSPDERWLFFTSHRYETDPFAARSFADLGRRLRSPDNGAGDLYWVDVRVLDPLRP